MNGGGRMMKKEMFLHSLMEEPFSISGKLLEHYKELGLTEVQLMILFHIKYFAQKGKYFPTPDDIQERMSISKKECTDELKELSKKGYLHIESRKDEEGRLTEAFSLLPLYEKLVVLLTNQRIDHQEASKQQEEGRLFQRFEAEFARPITPMELEMISMWLDDDKHDPVIIEAALREAVVSAKLNFRYIDRILFDWKKNGIRTVEQAKEHGERIRQRQTNTHESQIERIESGKSQRMKHPQYNWLQGE